MKLLALCVVACALVATGVAQPLYYPPINDTVWQRVTLDELGWDAGKIDSMVAYANRTLSKALIVLVGGRIAVEWYAPGRTVTSPWYWASAGKTVTATLVGALLQEGKLGLDDPTSKYLGRGWTSLPPEQEDRITIRNQLTMTSGLDDGVSNRDCTKPECLVYKADAGTRWAYHNAPYTLLDGVVEAASGESFQTVLRRTLLAKTGMTGQFVAMGDNNVMVSTPRSMARFGLLAQGKFVWNGTPVLTDTAYVNALTRPSQQLNPAYGYLWWLNGQATYKVPYLQIDFPGPIMREAPSDAVNALGKNNQIVSVSPSMNIVIVRMGDNPDSLLAGMDVPMTQANDLWRLLRSAMPTSSVASHNALPNAAIGIDGRVVTASNVINRCTITAITGEQITVVGGSGNTLELPQLAPGVYMLRTDTAAGTAYQLLPWSAKD